MNILIVDDSVQMRRLIRAVVCVPSDQCYECADGGAALTLYTQYRPDWVLMDIEMATGDGITAARQIRAAFPDARILILTSYDDPDLREAARAAGACGYILKENLLEVRRRVQARL